MGKQIWKKRMAEWKTWGGNKINIIDVEKKVLIDGQGTYKYNC